MASPANPLQAAKDALAKANKSFPSPAKSTNEFSKAPYSLVKKTADTGIAQEAESAGQGIKARLQNEGKAMKSLNE